jgi:hypothetical protein
VRGNNRFDLPLSRATGGVLRTHIASGFAAVTGTYLREKPLRYVGESRAESDGIHFSASHCPKLVNASANNTLSFHGFTLIVYRGCRRSVPFRDTISTGTSRGRRRSGC